MKKLALILLMALSQSVYGTSILIPMDVAQTNHLKAYVWLSALKKRRLCRLAAESIAEEFYDAWSERWSANVL